MRTFLVWFLCLICSLHVSAAEEGKDYRVISPVAKPNEPTVTVFFTYGCFSCQELESELDAWALNQKSPEVKLVRVPIVGESPEGDRYARLYYTAEAMGILAKTHRAAFAASKMDSDDAAATFLATFGPKKEEVLSVMKSFKVAANLARARELVKKIGVSKVPSFVVNDRYYFYEKNGLDAPSWQRLADTLLRAPDVR